MLFPYSSKFLKNEERADSKSKESF